MHLSKIQLREQGKAYRKSLTPLERAQKDRKILEKLKSLPEFQSAQTVFTYLSTTEEVDTHALIKAHLGRKRIIVPRIEPNHRLTLIELQQWEDLKLNRFGILEPMPEAQETTCSPEAIDLSLIPCVAFDPQKHRIGYGKGYYDRLLTETHGQHIGLAYEGQRTEAIPHEPHDIPLDHILTEHSIY